MRRENAMTSSIENRIKSIIEETTQFDFPFWASRDKKREIVLEKKSYIETHFYKLFPEVCFDEEVLIELWKESIEHSDERFKMLPEKHKRNGFYLQELCHCYAEKIGRLISDNR